MRTRGATYIDYYDVEACSGTVNHHKFIDIILLCGCKSRAWGKDSDNNTHMTHCMCCSGIDLGRKS